MNIDLTGENFYVIKKDDLICLNEDEKILLEALIEKVYAIVGVRKYFICSHDEPYSNRVLRAIVEGENEKRYKANG